MTTTKSSLPLLLQHLHSLGLGLGLLQTLRLLQRVAQVQPTIKLTKQDSVHVQIVAEGCHTSLTTIANSLLALHQPYQCRTMILVKELPPKQERTLAQSPQTRKMIISAASVARVTSQTTVWMTIRLQSRILTLATLHQTQTWRRASATYRVTPRLLATRILLLLRTTTPTRNLWLQGQVQIQTAAH